MTAPAHSPAPGLVAADFTAWTCECRVVVDDESALVPAVACIRALMAAVDDRVNPLRVDTALARAAQAGRLERPDRLTEDLLIASRRSARLTGGIVTPFPHRSDLRAAAARRDPLTRTDSGDWRWPAGALPDLGASAKAATADIASEAVSSERGCSVLVSLGGDIATAGARAFDVEVCDRPGDPRSVIRLAPGWAVATSSVQHRGRHILDPRTGEPAAPHWATASAAAPSCVEANALFTAAMVLGPEAVTALAGAGEPMRLVGLAGRVVTAGGWPADDPQHPDSPIGDLS